MKDVYQECPILEDERFLLKLVEENDAKDLLKVYSDQRALPFFNSDNCNGDNFYYTTEKRMLEGIQFWLWSYSNKAFVRFTIFDKEQDMAIGTIELFHRISQDYFNHCALLRLDLRPDYESCEHIRTILTLILESTYELFGGTMIATKAPIYAVERISALEKLGFTLSKEYLIGVHDGKAYDSYWVKEKANIT